MYKARLVAMGRIVKISVQTLRVTKMYLRRNLLHHYFYHPLLIRIVIFIAITITIIIIFMNFSLILLCQILLLETSPKIPLARLKINRMG